MYRKNRTLPASLSVCVLAGLLLSDGKMVSAADTGKIGAEKLIPTRMEGVRAYVDNPSTLLEVALTGIKTPVWEGAGKRWTVRFPATSPDRKLAENLQSGGIVSRIGVVYLKDSAETQLNIDLSMPAKCTRIQGRSRSKVCLRFYPLDDEGAKGAFHASANGKYDVAATRADVSSLMTSLAQEAGVSLVLTSNVNNKVTLNLQNAPVEKAMELLAHAAGLRAHREGDTYFVGTDKEIEALYPVPKPEEVKHTLPVIRQEVYTCRHIVASDLVKTLEKTFDKESLRVAIGVSGYTPRLDQAVTTAVTGIQSSGSQIAQTSGDTGSIARDIVISGESAVVEQALVLARKLDKRRAQVRIGVRISDINSEAVRELGLRWDWSKYAAREIPNVAAGAVSSSSTSGSTSTGSTTTPLVNGIKFGSFGHDPIFIEATLSALEKNDGAKLLASPTLSLLDGEKGFILIGDRLVFPVLTGYTQAQTPIFSKEEERVGIYLQVAVQTTENGEITLTLYPQVSVVTNYLVVNGASYPQISTREQQTTVRVKDGEKIIVGGLIRDEEIKNLEKIPVLSNIPFFGELFTYRKKTKRRSEVLIMITPEILKD